AIDLLNGRRWIDYGPLLDFSRLLAANLGLGLDAGPAAGPSFLLDLEAVWERYVTGTVVAAFEGRPDGAARVQPYLATGARSAGQPDLHLRPDVLVESAGRPRLVVDAKWKRLSGT